MIMVTHGKAHKGICDEEIDIRNGAIASDTSEEARQPSKDCTGSLSPEGQESAVRRPTRRISRIPIRSLRTIGPLTQVRVLIQRELLLTCKSWRKLVVPVVIVPVLFATAIHVALVTTTKLDLLGFLMVLASIWMGASLSLLSIVYERAIIDHEFLFYLRIPSYVLAKVLVLGLISVGQVSCFFWVLWLMRGLFGWGEMLYHPLWSWLSLLLIGVGGVTLGLLLSGLAGRNKDRANLVLPLIMMGQIVFSVQVSDNSASSLEVAYGRFQPHYCCVWPDRRSDRWIPSQGGWVSERARVHFGRQFAAMQANLDSRNESQIPTPEQANKIIESLRKRGADGGGGRVSGSVPSELGIRLSLLFRAVSIWRYHSSQLCLRRPNWPPDFSRTL